MTKEGKKYFIYLEQMMLEISSSLFLMPALNEAKNTNKEAVFDLSQVEKKIKRLEIFFEKLLENLEEDDIAFTLKYIQDCKKELNSYFSLAKTAQKSKIRITEKTLDFMMNLKDALSEQEERIRKLF